MNKLKQVGGVAIVGLFTTFNAIADSYTLRISEDVVGLGVMMDPIGESSSAEIDWMHADDFDLLRAGVYVEGLSPDTSYGDISQLTLKYGGKAVFLSSDFDDGAALALGLKAEYPFTEKLSLFSDVFYASGKLSFEEVDTYKEWAIGMRAKIFKNGSLSVGYTTIEVDTDTLNGIELEDGLMIYAAVQL